MTDKETAAAKTHSENSEADSASQKKRSLLTEFRETRNDLMRIWGSGFVVTVLAFTVSWFFLEPAPPSELSIASGPVDGAYFEFAERYAQVFAEAGVKLNVISTEGSVSNYEMLGEDSDVHLAIVQGGTKPSAATPEDFEAIASLYLEPLWVFYRGDETLNELRQLDGKRIAIGSPSSGTNALAKTLFNDNGIEDGVNGTVFVPVGGTSAADLLKSSGVDIAVFVMAASSPLIQRLAADPGIRLMDFTRHEAYRRRYSYLTSVELERGVMDLETDTPPKNVHLLAPAANLVATPELHDAFIPLLLKAAHKVHHEGSMFVDPGEFPTRKYVEFDVNESAQEYFVSGPSFLQKYVPFWVASAISRCKIFLLPLLTLLFPLFKIAPPLYRWRIRSRIYQWYGVLRKVDQRLKTSTDRAVMQKDLQALETMERELGTVSVPLSYMQEFYDLRVHLDLVERRLEQRLNSLDGEGSERKHAGTDGAATSVSSSSDNS